MLKNRAVETPMLSTIDHVICAELVGVEADQHRSYACVSFAPQLAKIANISAAKPHIFRNGGNNEEIARSYTNIGQNVAVELEQNRNVEKLHRGQQTGTKTCQKARAQ